MRSGKRNALILAAAATLGCIHSNLVCGHIHLERHDVRFGDTRQLVASFKLAPRVAPRHE